MLSVLSASPITQSVLLIHGKVCGSKPECWRHEYRGVIGIKGVRYGQFEPSPYQNCQTFKLVDSLAVIFQYLKSF